METFKMISAVGPDTERMRGAVPSSCWKQESRTEPRAEIIRTSVGRVRPVAYPPRLFSICPDCFWTLTIYQQGQSRHCVHDGRGMRPLLRRGDRQAGRNRRAHRDTTLDKSGLEQVSPLDLP